MFRPQGRGLCVWVLLREEKSGTRRRRLCVRIERDRNTYKKWGKTFFCVRFRQPGCGAHAEAEQIYHSHEPDGFITLLRAQLFVCFTL